jgi:hypothetical protein
MGYLFFFVWILACFIFIPVVNIAQSGSIPSVFVDTRGQLVYTSDSLGNRIPDFSYCGYMAAEERIPDIPARVLVPLSEGDATIRIQSAINYVASLQPDSSGFRGAVLFEKGCYEIYGRLKISTSGVVLRGSGMGQDGTLLMAMGKDRETLISIAGKNDRELKTGISITDSYVPVNTSKLHVPESHSLKAGDYVLVKLPCTRKWIQKLDMGKLCGEDGWLSWKPGERIICWDRQIIFVDEKSVTLDAPITTALDTDYGGGSITKYNWPGKISNVGIENLCCLSDYNKGNPEDEDHCWMAVTMENVYDAWVRQVVFMHFAGSAVAIYETAKRVTVEDCKSLSPVSEIGGQRRYTFFTEGQQILFQRLYAEYGYHDFAAGFCAAGPNAFVQCESHLPYSFSGTIDSWASGVLFDNVCIDGHSLCFINRGMDYQAAGWTAANSVMWQCTASRIDCYSPPTASNWAFGSRGQLSGNGYWSSSNQHIKPQSLYYAQLQDRLGDRIQVYDHLLPVETGSATSPTIEQAASFSAQSEMPAITLSEWIDMAYQRKALNKISKDIVTIDQLDYSEHVKVSNTGKMLIENGWLVRDSTVLTGNRHKVSWCRGSACPYGIKKATPHITRFVPGRTGKGLTDDLSELIAWMNNNHMIALEHNYGLWYDRRRDDHSRVRRMNGEVWPPFYELPFARSGQGKAWDGLSKYDLTEYNYWYWMRLKKFADLADQRGLVLIHQNYFQHNILEAGAHWVDFPWRTANNINNTGFPEPPSYAGDKRIFMAEQFYDVTHPVRSKLHKSYIRKCLENFDGNNGVIQLTGGEYTGPLSFVKFWIDVIMEWEQEKGKKVFIGLSVTKDVQDSVLTDPVRLPEINLIDIRYWHYREDGSLFAPAGGKNLAPRQHARLDDPGKSSFEQVYRAVLEYRNRYKDKAVIYSADLDQYSGWAVFMAGGSLANIPEISDPQFLKDAVMMQPVDLPVSPEDKWALGNAEKGYIIYNNSSGPIQVDLTKSAGMFRIRWIDPEDGSILEQDETVKGGDIIERKNPQPGPVIMWIKPL